MDRCYLDKPDFNSVSDILVNIIIAYPVTLQPHA